MLGVLIGTPVFRPGALEGPCPRCIVMASVVIDKVNADAERTQKEERIILQKKSCAMWYIACIRNMTALNS